MRVKVLKNINDFFALLAILSFIVLLRIENTSFSNEVSRLGLKIASFFLFIFGSIYLFNKFIVREAGGALSRVSDTYSKNRIIEINKQIIRISLISAPAYLAIGIGVYFLYDSGIENPDSAIWYGVIAVGVIIELMIFVKLLPLFRERASLFRNKSEG